jgi:hypothetical protein
MAILLQHEVQNNLPIGFIKNQRGADTSDWLMATVKDDTGSILLTAACTPPFNILLFETGNKPVDAAVQCLSAELKGMDFQLPGVMAEQDLARRFARYFTGNDYHRHQSMIIMRLDTVSEIPSAPGNCRPLTEDDLFFAPYWEHAFAEECRVEVYDIPANVARMKKRLERQSQFIWEDRVPVSQAAHGRSTENGAVVNSVYTPPHFRGRGYATSLVAAVSQRLLDQGYKFTCLFADAENPISCGIYRKIGYVDQCVFDVLRFGRQAEPNRDKT